MKRTKDRLLDMQAAIQLAIAHVEGLEKAEFHRDIKTQQAVAMNLIIIGEAATALMQADPEFTARHSELHWKNIRGMRNRIAHGYFEIDMDIVWETVQAALPELLTQLPNLIEAASSEDTYPP